MGNLINYSLSKDSIMITTDITRRVLDVVTEKDLFFFGKEVKRITCKSDIRDIENIRLCP